MPYDLSFTAPFRAADSSRYINDCCRGGDVIRDRIMPAIAARYQGIRTGQEDWGWFIWFEDGAVRLAIDIFCDDPDAGDFRVRLTSRRKKWFGSEILDTPELDRLRDSLLDAMKTWAGPLIADRVED